MLHLFGIRMPAQALENVVLEKLAARFDEPLTLRQFLTAVGVSEEAIAMTISA